MHLRKRLYRVEPEGGSAGALACRPLIPYLALLFLLSSSISSRETLNTRTSHLSQLSNTPAWAVGPSELSIRIANWQYRVGNGFICTYAARNCLICTSCSEMLLISLLYCSS